MNYFTGIATSPAFEFPYSGYPTHSISNLDSDINAILANITPSLGTQIYNQPQSCTLQCVPQINTGIGDGTVVYQVPENMPIDMILQQLGINTDTLQPSNTISNYYRTGVQIPEVYLSSPSSPRPRRLVCREASDSEDDGYLRRPPHRRHSRPWSDQPEQSSLALHNILGKVWQKAEQKSQNLPSSFSAPNINSQWQSMRNRTSPPPNFNANNVWQAMRNASPTFPPDNRNAINNVWQRADHASDQRSNNLSDMFNRMRQPTGNIIQPPPPPLQNREAVQDFFAARNLPYGVNAIPPNREAVQDFFAARNLPYGVNAIPPNREALQDFNAVRNLPYGVNAIPPNREALQDFFAARNLPYGVNAIPPNREALQDFNAVRNLPYGVNAIPPNREALQDFFAARNLPYGVNAIPPNQDAMRDFNAIRNLPYGVNAIPPNREALQDFNAVRNLPYGINAGPPPPNAAINDFFAARHVPFGINQPNPAIANVWNRADYAAQQAPPMINVPWNQGPTSPPPPPMNNMWNRMQQGPPAPYNPPYPTSPMGLPPRGPSNLPAPTSFASLLSQAHRQNLPYAGGA